MAIAGLLVPEEKSRYRNAGGGGGGGNGLTEKMLMV